MELTIGKNLGKLKRQNLGKLRDRKVFYNSTKEIESRTNMSEVESREIIVIVTGRKKKWAILKCPCGCGEEIDVNLMKGHYPRWNFRLEKDGTASFFPSLWISKEKCGSHFIIDHSRVYWASELLNLLIMRRKR